MQNAVRHKNGKYITSTITEKDQHVLRHPSPQKQISFEVRITAFNVGFEKKLHILNISKYFLQPCSQNSLPKRKKKLIA